VSFHVVHHRYIIGGVVVVGRWSSVIVTKLLLWPLAPPSTVIIGRRQLLAVVKLIDIKN
jgi:hypothetical protein